MGLLNARNLRKAKALLEKNRHKVGDMVGKATEQVDKVSKGKTATYSAKVEDAARKYSAGGVTHHGDPSATPTGSVDDVADFAPIDEAELQRRQAEANIAAANALKSAADAAASVFGRAASGSSAGTSPDDGAATQTGSVDQRPPED